MNKTNTAKAVSKSGLLITVSAAALFASSCAVPKAEQVTLASRAGETERFPEYRAKDLNGKMVTVPGNGSSEHALVFVAFQRKHQKVIDRWLAQAKPLIKKSPSLDFLELPVIRKMNPISRWFLYRGMRWGIPSTHTRARVVTLHLDKKQLRRELAIPDESTVHVFLVRRADRAILWRTHGNVTPKAVTALESQLQRLPSAATAATAAR